MWSAVVTTFVLASACGDNTHNIIQLDVGLGTPDLIMFRDDGGPWQEPKVVADGSYTFEVLDDYEVVAVYSFDDGSFLAQELAATYRDGNNWGVVWTSQFGALVTGKTGPYSIFRYPCSPFPRDGTVKVTGRMLDKGQVAMDSSCMTSAVAPWMFSLDVLPGTNDLIATGRVGATPSIAIQRGLVVDGATAIPDIDLSSVGTPLTTMPVAVVNTDESGIAATNVILTTSAGASNVSGTSAEVSAMHTISTSLVPTSVMEPGDRQALEVHSPGGDFAPVDRSARTIFTGNEIVFELIPSATISYDVVNGVDVVSWGSALAPRYGYVDFNIESVPNANLNYSGQHVTVTKHWLEDHKATSVGFDTDVPGYDAAWSIDRTQQYGRWFDVRDDSTNITYMTTNNSQVGVTFPPGIVAPRPQHRVRPGSANVLPN
jgi:hypothetical protein